MMRATIEPVRQATSKTRQFLNCLLCVLILIATLDRVPDPPSIKPHHDAAKVFSIGNHQSPVVNHHSGSDALASNVLRRAQSFFLSLLVVDELLLPSAFHLDQASDSSPPHSAS